VQVSEDGGVVVQTPDGRRIVVGSEGVSVGGTPGQLAAAANDVIPDGAVAISIAFFVMIALILIGLPIARAIARRLDRSTPAAVSPAFRGELQTLRESVERLSVDVERVAEGQRWMTRQLTDASPAARQGEQR